MNNEKIANRQLWFILFMMRSTIILAFLLVLTSANALQDAWISAIVTLVGSEVFVLLISLLAIRFPDKTIIEYSQILLGKWPGKLLGLVFLWLYLQLSVVDIRIYGEVLATGFLPETPLLFVIGIMVLASTICIQQGVEILGRMADILFFFFIVMIFSVILISIGDFQFLNLQPVFARGWEPIIKGAITPTCLISQIWVLGMLVPVTLKPAKTVSIAMSSVGVSILILVVIAILTIGVLSPQEGARATFPILELVRSIQVSAFLQRLEALVIFSWGFGLFISVTTFVYSGAFGFAQWLNIKDYRSILLPMAVIWIYLAYGGFENIFEIYQFLEPKTFGPYGFFVLLVPLALLWSGYGLKKITGKI